MQHTHSLEAREPNDHPTRQRELEHGEAIDANRRAALDLELRDCRQRHRQGARPRVELEPVVAQLEAAGVTPPLIVHRTAKVPLIHRTVGPFPVHAIRAAPVRHCGFLRISSERAKVGTMASATRVLIVDDHAVVRTGIRLLLDRESDIESVGEASSGREAILEARSLKPDVS